MVDLKFLKLNEIEMESIEMKWTCEIDLNHFEPTWMKKKAVRSEYQSHQKGKWKGNEKQ